MAAEQWEEPRGNYCLVVDGIDTEAMRGEWASLSVTCWTGLGMKIGKTKSKHEPNGRVVEILPVPA